MSHPSQYNSLLANIQQQVVVAVKATMSTLYWRIDFAINEEFKQCDKKENYGKQIIATPWRQLPSEYGTSVSEKNIQRMMQFATVFPDEKTVVSLIRQSSLVDSHDQTFKVGILIVTGNLKRQAA